MRSFPLLRPLAVLLAIVGFTGCSSWRPVPGSPDPARIPADTEDVRVTLSDGSRLNLYAPVFQADSLRGFDSKYTEDGFSREKLARRALAPANIASLEQKHSDTGKTVGLILGIGLAIGLAGAAALYISMASGGSRLGDLGSGQTLAGPAPVTR